MINQLPLLYISIVHLESVFSTNLGEDHRYICLLGKLIIVGRILITSIISINNILLHYIQNYTVVSFIIVIFNLCNRNSKF